MTPRNALRALSAVVAVIAAAVASAAHSGAQEATGGIVETHGALVAGAEVTLSGIDVRPGSSIEVSVWPGGQVLDTTPGEVAGEVTVTLPDPLPAGDARLAVVDRPHDRWPTGGLPDFSTLAIVVDQIPLDAPAGDVAGDTDDDQFDAGVALVLLAAVAAMLVGAVMVLPRHDD